MSNKEIVEKVIAGFEQNDTDTILSYMTDDVEWVMLGHKNISGKGNLRKWFVENTEMKMISSTKDHFIIDGDHAAVDGDVQCTGKNGEVFDMYYCDIYELENGKLKKLISYTINKKK